MKELVDLALAVAIISLAAGTSINAYRYGRESEYWKQKYMDRGYWKGYRQAEKDYKILNNVKGK